MQVESQRAYLEICPVCKGNGYVRKDKGIEQCSACDSKGELDKKKSRKELWCPHCGGSMFSPTTKSGHFAWQDLACEHCEEIVSKHDWLTTDDS